MHDRVQVGCPPKFEAPPWGGAGTASPAKSRLEFPKSFVLHACCEKLTTPPRNSHASKCQFFARGPLATSGARGLFDSATVIAFERGLGFSFQIANCRCGRVPDFLPRFVQALAAFFPGTRSLALHGITVGLLAAKHAFGMVLYIFCCKSSIVIHQNFQTHLHPK